MTDSVATETRSLALDASVAGVSPTMTASVASVLPSSADPPADLQHDSTFTPSMVNPSACACQSGGNGLQLVYTLGKLSFDYGTRARRNYFANAFLAEDRGLNNIDSAAQLIRYLEAKVPEHYKILSGNRFANRTDVTSIIWTLSIDDTPIYAIAPSDAFAFEIHDLLVEFLGDQVDEEVRLAQINEAIHAKRSKPQRTKDKDDDANLLGGDISLEIGRVAIAGVIAGQVTLYTGETVPVIRPDSRGLRNWTTKALLDAAQQQAFGKGEPTAAEIAATRDLGEFLNVAYSQTRNLGITPQDRALNYAATDAFILQTVFRNVREDNRFRQFEFDSFEVSRSPICRPDADCWDVTLYFYDPNELRRARCAVRYTVDVSDVVPVMLGRRQDFTVR